MNLLARAHAGLSLTPSERALLKLVEGFLGAAFLSLVLALPTALAYAQGNQIFTVAGLSVMAGAFVRGFMMAWEKYVSAKGDKPLAGAIDATNTAIQQALPLHQQATPTPAPAPVAAPASAAPDPTASAI